MANLEQPTLTSLSAKIAELSGTLAKFHEEQKVRPVSFAADSPSRYEDLTPEMFMVRQNLLDALTDMSYLAQGPSDSIFNYVHTAIPDASVLNTLNAFDFWSAVPLDGTASYEEISAHVSLPRDVVYRLLQHAMTQRIFAAAEPGRVKHTSRSAALAKSTGLKALVSAILDDAGAPVMVLNEALRRYNVGKSGLVQDTDKTSFALFHAGGQFGGFRNTWELLENDGEGERKGWRQRKFVEFMEYLKDLFRLEGVVLNYSGWPSEGKVTVVDIGGSAGHDAIVLAKRFPEMEVVVEDLGEARPSFDRNIPPELTDRVRFVDHSFFDPQPISADIYLLKMILHDWPDAECIKILRNLVPVLKPGAKVLLIEYIGGAGDEESDQSADSPRSLKQYGTATDVRLMAIFNGKERPINAWKSIFTAADERFKISDTDAIPHGFFGVIEAVWEG
ncbi:putative O-methyltransferase domain-containing protein [Seiridium cardinale]